MAKKDFEKIDSFEVSDDFDEQKRKDTEAALKTVRKFVKKLERDNYSPDAKNYYFFHRSLGFLKMGGFPADEVQALRDRVFEKSLSWGSDKRFSINSYDMRMRHLHFLLTFHRGKPLSASGTHLTTDPSPEKALLVKGEIQEEEEHMLAFLDSNPNALPAYLRRLKASLATPDDIDPFKKMKMSFQPNHPGSLSFLAKVHDEILVKSTPQGKKYYINIDGEDWELTYFFEDSYGVKLVLRSVSDSDAFGVINVEKLEGLFEGDSLSEFALEKKQDVIRERENAEVLTQYDYPKDKKVGYYRVFPEIYDNVVSASLGFSSLVSHQLSQNYPNLSVAPIIYGQSDMQDRIKQSIKEGYANGIRVFHLDIYNHGLEGEGLAFFDNLQLGDIIKELLEDPELSDATFNISTMACFGGGFRDEFMELAQQDSQVADRVNLFLQSTPDAVNYAGLRPISAGAYRGAMRIISTYYNIFLLEGLSKGMKYGEAVHYADQRAKEFMNTNSESIIDGTLVQNEGQDDYSVTV